MVDSKRAIEAVLGEPVDTFAYPYGACDAQTRELARRHFRIACGVRMGYAGPNSDRLELERLDMYYLRHQPDLANLFAPRTRFYVAVRAAVRAARRLLA